MPDEEDVYDSNSVLVVKTSHLPESVSKWILEESGNVFEGSPFLCHISGFSSFSDEFCKIAISLLGKSSAIIFLIRFELTFRSYQLFRSYLDYRT